MTTQQLVTYYSNLLILQYLQKPKAVASIQTTVTPILMPQVGVQEISFALSPTIGSFILSWNGNPTAAINWNDSVASIQTKIQAISGLSSVIVTGSIAGLLLTVTFNGIQPVASSLVLTSNSLQASGVSVIPQIIETDLTLPIAIQNAFNLTAGPLGPVASGVQLDVLGKYVGVLRSGYGVNGPVVLSDADFLTLIQFAIITNNSGSSLSDIQNAIFQFFPDEILVFDYQNMHMSYLVNSSIGSQDLVQILINENLFPKPMGVQLATIIYNPVITEFFGFRTYDLPAFNANPFNDYDNYQTDWPWLSYDNVLSTTNQLLIENGNSLVQENGDLIYTDP